MRTANFGSIWGALRAVVIRALLVGALWSTAAISAHMAAAQDGAADGESAEESRAEAFRAVEGAVEEDIAGGPLMLTVYAVTWVFVFLYVLRLVSLQQRTLKEVERLNAQLGTANQTSGE